MLMSMALLALLAAGPPVPAPGPAPPVGEPPAAKQDAPAVDPATAAAGAAPAAPSTPATAPPAAKPNDDKPALVVGDLRLAPRAQLRLRGEVIGDRTLKAAFPASVVTHRARLGLDAEWKDMARLVFEMQDVRGWGAEQSPTGQPPDGTIFGKVLGSVDLHQAYAGVFFGPTELRVGRQEIVFANERVLGAVDWAQTGRSFDAIRFGSRPPGDLSYLAFCSLVRDRDHLPGVDVTGLALCGGGVEHKVMPELRYAPLLLAELVGTAALIQRATLGARVDGAIAGFSYDVDVHGQALWLNGEIKAAFLLGARAAYEIDTLLHPKVGAVVDVASGGDPAAGSTVTFDTTFGTNHKFYGFQDLFLNLPLHTQNRGLLDAAGNLWVKEGPFSGALAVHAFAPTAYVGAGTAFYGIEPDLLARYNPTGYLGIEAGGALFVPIGEALGRGGAATPWVYASIDLKL